MSKEQEIISKIKYNPNITEYEIQLNLVFNTSFIIPLYTFLILQATHVSIMSKHWFIQWSLFFELLIFPKDFFKSSNCKFAFPYFLAYSYVFELRLRPHSLYMTHIFNTILPYCSLTLAFNLHLCIIHLFFNLLHSS